MKEYNWAVLGAGVIANETATVMAKITDAESGESRLVKAGKNEDALWYEIEDMEKSVSGEDCMHLNYTEDVMHLMTSFRQEWNMKYPEEM
ncbi:hypothetical protein [uncultured Eubacterium sp.]|uniref:hypothetical protein n=1 Tax=uncultured Eubacterium sp. TaxID=165185 RepID=UPI0015B297F6|nr:hypothetical protein [uncultured Eubacterium sp.]